MAPAPQPQSRRVSYQSYFLLALFCVFSTACTTAPTGKILFDDPRGTVSLQTTSDPSIQATQPVNLEPILLAQVLKGIEVQHQDRGIQRLLTGSVAPIPVFSDDQIQFLAPLLAEGLRTAGMNERVAFLVRTTYEGSMLESSTTETTSGSLYAYGRQLCVILSQYRSSPKLTKLNAAGDSEYKSMPPDLTGLKNHIVLFTPRAAQRSDRIDPPGGLQTTDRFVAVDYQLLQQKPPAPVTAEKPVPEGTSAASGASAQSTEDLAREVEALKKEMQSLKQQQQQGNQKQK